MRLGKTISELTPGEIESFFAMASRVINGGVDDNNFYDDEIIDSNKVIDLPSPEKPIDSDKFMPDSSSESFYDDIIKPIEEKVSYPYNTRTVSIPLSLDENNASSEGGQSSGEFEFNRIGAAISSYALALSPLKSPLTGPMQDIARNFVPQYAAAFPGKATDAITGAADKIGIGDEVESVASFLGLGSKSKAPDPPPAWTTTRRERVIQKPMSWLMEDYSTTITVTGQMRKGGIDFDYEVIDEDQSTRVILFVSTADLDQSYESFAINFNVQILYKVII